MKFKAEINVMPKEGLLDPQGKILDQKMGALGLAEIENVRVGRRIQLIVEANDKETASQKVDDACKKILVNQVMETYTFQVEEVELV